MESIKYRILVLCTANIGRSPLAEVILRSRLAEALGVENDALASLGIEVRSAGTRGPVGFPASHRCVVVADELGLDLSGHRSARLTVEMARSADRILCADDSQIADVVAMDPGLAARTERLDPSEEIPDPRGQDLAFYMGVRRRIEAAVDRRIPEMADEIRRRS